MIKKALLVVTLVAVAVVAVASVMYVRTTPHRANDLCCGSRQHEQTVRRETPRPMVSDLHADQDGLVVKSKGRTQGVRTLSCSTSRIRKLRTGVEPKPKDSDLRSSSMTMPGNGHDRRSRRPHQGRGSVDPWHQKFRRVSVGY